MSKVIITSQKLIDLADAVRSHKDIANALTLSEMANLVTKTLITVDMSRIVPYGSEHPSGYYSGPQSYVAFGDPETKTLYIPWKKDILKDDPKLASWAKAQTMDQEEWFQDENYDYHKNPEYVGYKLGPIYLSDDGYFEETTYKVLDESLFADGWDTVTVIARNDTEYIFALQKNVGIEIGPRWY